MDTPQGGSCCPLWPSMSNWNLECSFFMKGGKPKDPQENRRTCGKTEGPVGKPKDPQENPRSRRKPSEQGRKPTKSSTHMWHQFRELDPGRSGNFGFFSSYKLTMKPFIPSIYMPRILWKLFPFICLNKSEDDLIWCGCNLPSHCPFLYSKYPGKQEHLPSSLHSPFGRQAHSSFVKENNCYYNIARVLVLCKFYWAAMNKIF